MIIIIIIIIIIKMSDLRFLERIWWHESEPTDWIYTQTFLRNNFFNSTSGFLLAFPESNTLGYFYTGSRRISEGEIVVTDIPVTPG